MAAYAALLSLMHTIKQIQQHPRPPIYLHGKQVDHLTDNVTFFQNFLEGIGSKDESDDLESGIACAAHAAEDVIESHVADRIHGESIGSLDFYQRLERVIHDMYLIKKKVVIAKEKMGAQNQRRRSSAVSSGSVKPASTAQNNITVGFNGVLSEVMDKLTGQPYNREIIPIVGMGGIGKTTLARNIYANPLIVQHFDVLTWVTVSQEYCRSQILRVLCQGNKGSTNDLSKMSEDELGEALYKLLWGSRYLIVMDDKWSVEAWDIVKSFFPDNNNGSKIVITTRLSNLAFQLTGSYGFQMKFLDEDISWNLLHKLVFGEKGCLVELENIGKEIARNCRGLPLSIVVIGGLLTKSEMTREYWEYTLENLNSLINLGNDEHSSQILHTSYKELPIHLKPCFLYLGVFPEDYRFQVSDLIELWVAEGFLKPVDDKSLEVVAKEYFKELIDRNLILVHELRWNGEARSCKIHDLLRDLCLREAQKQRFLCILRRQQYLNIPQDINIERRICIHEDAAWKYSPQALHAFQSLSLTRSLLLAGDFHEPSPSLRLLRVYSGYHTSPTVAKESIFQQANLRYLSVQFDFSLLSRFPFSLSLFWNLQTLKIFNPSDSLKIAPSEIWKMSQLRHVIFDGGLELAEPPNGEDIVLDKLQTLLHVYNFECGDNVVNRIPNIKRLKLYYEERLEEGGLPHHYHNNLSHLQKLESLEFNLWFDFIPDPEMLRSHFVQNLSFPRSLKKLTLCGTNLHWEDLTTKIGSLPLLQVLKLREDSCIGPEWRTVEGQFCSLKFLFVEDCLDLEHWMTESTHFPRLEYLVLGYLPYLKEIPSSIGDIPTLQSIELDECSDYAADSVERIKWEQEELGNAGLEILIDGMEVC